jgi:uncharacterized protein (DUF1330 family)
MAAYIISDVTIKDGAAIDIYRQRAAASIAQHGGRYIVRGGEIEVLEGAWRRVQSSLPNFPTWSGRARGIALPNTRPRWRCAMRR